MHAGVGVGVGEFEEVVAVEVRHLLAQPFVLHAIEIPIQNEMFPAL